MRKGYAEYISTWQKQMDEAWKIAYEKSSKRKAADRKRWNKGPVLTELKCGDRVLVRNLTECGGPGKLRNYWESAVDVVTRIVGESHVVYEVQAESNKRAKKRILHRNMLLPCEELVKDQEEVRKTKQPPKKKPTPRRSSRLLKDEAVVSR